MNICMVSDLYDTPYGGVSTVIKRIVPKLLERGHKVIIITSMFKGKNPIERKGNLVVYRFPSVVLPKCQQEFSFSFPSIQKIFEIYKNEKVEIIHCHVPSLLTVICILVAKDFKIPIIATHHMDSETYLANLGLVSKETRFLFYRTLNIFFNHADLVTTPSHYKLKLVKKHGLKTKGKVLSNGIDLSRFKSDIDCKPFLRKFKLKKGTKKILFVGRLMREKGIDVLVKALPIINSKIPNTKLIIVGKGYLEEELKKLVNELKLKNVIFTGFISLDMLRQVYASCDIFVLPSFVESQGLVLLEALASGKPAVGSKITAIPELVVNGWNGYTFKPGNHEELAKKIIRILSDEKLMKKFSKNSLKLVKKHDMEKIVDKLEKTYKDFIKY